MSIKCLSCLKDTQSKPEDTSYHSSPVHDDADISVLMSPAVRVLLETYQLNPRLIPATGPKGRLLKGDVLRYVAQGGKPFTKPEEETSTQMAPPQQAQPAPQASAPPEKSMRASQTTGKCLFLFVIEWSASPGASGKKFKQGWKLNFDSTHHWASD